MNKFCTGFLLLSILLTSNVNAQNLDFESWTDGNPTGWFANNVPPVYSTITQSATAHSGTSAAKGEVIDYMSFVTQPILQSGDDAGGFAFSQRPASVSVYYQFFPAASSGDRFGLNVVLYKGGVGGIAVAVAAIAPGTTVSSYTQLTATFNYSTNDIPDTCVVQMQIVGPGTGDQATPHVGSYFLVDDVSFSGPTAVTQSVMHPKQFGLEQNFPNPFNPSTNIRYSLSQASHVDLTVYDLLGNEVATLVKGEMEAGEHTVTFNASHMSSGMYFYTLRTKNFSETKRMMLIQ
ncbi:MAG: T9SS type A sorting domain-containing protein [Bacteroidota bacterium]